MFNMSISSAQCRAARGLVAMDQAVLAEGASVSRNVVIDFEKGRRTPTRNNLAAIQRVLEAAGVEFTNGNRPGVRLKEKKML
jgi:DNA-binding transcriptional regulator YiaG